MVSTSINDRFWVALVSPRNALLDNFSDKPFLRNIFPRLPALLRPKAESYGHIIAVGEDGRVVENLQDPSGSYPHITSVTETEEYLYFGSSVAPRLGRLSKKNRI